MSYNERMTSGGTTVWIDSATREKLRRLQASFGTDSVNATIRRLIESPTQDARALFAKHRAEIRAILRKHALRGLVAFGSRARGDAGPTSDLDLAVQRTARAKPLAILAAEADLEELFGLPVDLVEIPNPKLDAVIKKEGVKFGE